MLLLSDFGGGGGEARAYDSVCHRLLMPLTKAEHQDLYVQCTGESTTLFLCWFDGKRTSLPHCFC